MVDGDGGDGASLLMMQPLEIVEPCWRCLVDALCLHVFIDACGWIPCYMMPWGHDGDDMMLTMT